MRTDRIARRGECINRFVDWLAGFLLYDGQRMGVGMGIMGKCQMCMRCDMHELEGISAIGRMDSSNDVMRISRQTWRNGDSGMNSSVISLFCNLIGNLRVRNDKGLDLSMHPFTCPSTVQDILSTQVKCTFPRILYLYAVRARSTTGMILRHKRTEYSIAPHDPSYTIPTILIRPTVFNQFSPGQNA